MCDMHIIGLPFVISGVSETAASRGGLVFTHPETLECDAAQAYPPESKTNIRQVAAALSIRLRRFKRMVVGCVGCVGCSSHITLSAKAFIFSWTLNPSRGNRSGNQVKSRHPPPPSIMGEVLVMYKRVSPLSLGLLQLRLKQEWLAWTFSRNNIVIFLKRLFGRLNGFAAKNMLLFVSSLAEKLLSLQECNIVISKTDFLATLQKIHLSQFCQSVMLQIVDHQEFHSLRCSVSVLLWSRPKYLKDTHMLWNFMWTFMVPRGCTPMTLVTFFKIGPSAKRSLMLRHIY